MRVPAEESLAYWGIKPDRITPLTARENQVYHIVSGQDHFALKLSRVDYHSKDALKSERALLEFLVKEGFSPLEPIALLKGGYLLKTDAGYASLTRWIEGTRFGVSNKTLKRSADDFFQLGCEMAKFHLCTQKWQKPSYFSRPNWHHKALVSHAPFWGRFWENPYLTQTEAHIFNAFRAYIKTADIEDSEQILHCDLVPENIILSKNALIFIDYDDFGTGNALFDIATALLKIDKNPDYALWKEHLIAGYSSLRPLDFNHLPLFMALRACTYIGWIMARPELDANGHRSKRYSTHALEYIQQLKGELW